MATTSVRLIRVTDETTRAELLEAIALLCAEAETMSRRGIAFVRGDAEYEQRHAQIDALCAELEGRAE